MQLTLKPSITTFTTQATQPSRERVAVITTVARQSPMLVGLGTPIDLAAYPDANSGLLFNKPGKGLNVAQTLKAPSSVWTLTSFKDTPTDALVNTYLSALIADGGLCVHPEPEGDLPAAQYMTDWANLVRLRNAHPNGERVTLVAKLTRYANMPKPGGGGKGPAAMWIPPDVDMLGADCYFTDITARLYPSPQQFYAAPMMWADSAGLPLSITELGLRQLDIDIDGSMLADAIVEHLIWLRDNGIVLVNYWDGAGSQFVYTLPAKARAALKAFMASGGF